MGLKECTTCGRKTSGYTEFRCPGCGKTNYIRCEVCRKVKAMYKCKECGFEGP